MQRLRNFILKNEAVINIKKPTEYLYMKILSFNMFILNAWPLEQIGEKKPKYMVFVYMLEITTNVFCFISAALYMIINIKTLTFYELGHMLISLFMDVVVTSRLLLTLPISSISTKYRDVTSLFLNKVHLFYHKEVSDYAMKTHKRVHVISHIFTIYLTCIMCSGIILFNVIPMWSNYSSGKYKETILYNSTYEHSLYFTLPQKVHTHFNAYLIVCICNWILSYLCGIMFCMPDLLLSLMVFNVWGHLKILLNNLESFPMPTNKAIVPISDGNVTVTAEMYSKEELKEVSRKLKQCIDHHRYIMGFTNKMSDVFGPMLFVYYVFHQASGCLLLLECSQMTVEALMRYVPLTVLMLQQLIQLSVIFELIGSTSEKLKDAVYGVPWYYMDEVNRKTVAIFLVNVQYPIHVKALGVCNVGVTSMATILKTSMSYFTFLRSL